MTDRPLKILEKYMQLINFIDHRKSGDDGYDLYRLFADLETKKDIKIIFQKDTYDIMPDYCSERALHISNHGWNGFKRIAFLLEDMENVELDFCGSTLISHGVMTVFALLNSKNVTVKNVTLENPSTGFMQTRVVSHGEGFVDLEKETGADQFIIRRDGELAYSYYEANFNIQNAIEFRPDTGEIEYGTGDFPFEKPLSQLRVAENGKNGLRVYDVKRYPPIGNRLVFFNTRRLGCAFFCEDSVDLHFENVTIHSCVGMGLLAQTCHNITLDNFSTRRKEGQYYTANVDATHFVNCTGLVKVENSLFEGQFDDALNIHGIYARVESVSGHEMLVREVHGQAKGIKVFREGDRIQAVNFNSLIPYTEKTIEKAEYVNGDIIRLSLLESAEDVKIGDNIESLDRSADLIFRNNIVRDNRARGMLIATRGRVLIEDNFFHTSGSAILFEANGDYWYESGGTLDVTVKNNTFDRCRYARWGNATISCVPRKATEDGKHFHRNIRIIDNSFNMLDDPAVAFDNVENAVFENNSIAYAGDRTTMITVKHTKNASISTDAIIEYLEDQNA